MSVYSTPTRTCIDEGSSPTPSSNQSFYFTPGETFSFLTPQTKSRKRATPYRGRVPKFNVYNKELSRSDDNLHQNNDIAGVTSPIPITVRDAVKWECQNAHSARETVISIDKENIGVQLCSTPYLPLGGTPSKFTPLRNISNQPNDKNATVFEARISSIGKHFDLRVKTEADVDQPTKCSVVRNSPNSTSSSNKNESAINLPVTESSSNRTKKKVTLFRRFGIGRKSPRKLAKINSKSVQKSGEMVDTRTQIDGEINSASFSKEDVENTDVSRIEDERLRVKDETSSMDKNSSGSPRPPLLIEKKSSPRKIKFWQFVRIKRFRISPVKRLFTKPTRYLISFKEKITKRFSRHPIKTLLNSKPEDISTETNSVQTHRICTLCLENLNTKEEAMSKALSALMAKLTSMEEELKEIKGYVKNNASSISNHNRNVPVPPLPPPPPPPPPPPNFLNLDRSAGTLKRKADLTTPENVDHAVKRPAIKNEKTQFSITVEDIRSVKLRKTPARVFKPRETNQPNTVNGDDAPQSLRMKNIKKSVKNERM
ncbi:uncharacterized protein LOC135836744 isoform X2 [Planococcus citri]|uniref:uncharacterized protein LOC135836744 isoform X2 n=1 Tax=Planococcus citri TaxID=170843 RepID=UPI0031F78A09